MLPYIENSAKVRAVLNETKADFFTPEDPDERVSLLDHDEIEEGEESKVNESSSSLDLLEDTRLMFTELLKGEYTSQIEDGELDPREYDGYLVNALLSSTDFAHEAAKKGNALGDWEFSQIGDANELFYRSLNFVHGVGRCCSALPKGPKEQIRAFVQSSPFQYDRNRLDVLRALSFIDAHQGAEVRLQDEFDETAGDEVTAAFRAVLKESQAEIRKARKVLRAQNKKELAQVISHFLCTILNNKEARHVKLLLGSGILLQREGRHMLEQIDENLKRIRRCSLMEEDEVHESDGLPMVERRPRKRKKQKSIL